MIIMLSLRLTSLYHIVRAAGGIERVRNTGLQILLLQLLIGVKLLFWWRHKYLTLLGIIEFDMVDTHPMKVVHSLIVPPGRHKQRHVNGFQRRLLEERRGLLLPQMVSHSQVCLITCVSI